MPVFKKERENERAFLFHFLSKIEKKYFGEKSKQAKKKKKRKKRKKVTTKNEKLIEAQI